MCQNSCFPYVLGGKKGSGGLPSEVFELAPNKTSQKTLFENKIYLFTSLSFMIRKRN